MSEIEAIIEDWWESCTQPQRTDHEESEVRTRLVQCGIDLGAKIRESEVQLISSGRSREAVGLILELRAIVRELATMARYSWSSAQIPEFERMLEALLLPTLDLTLAACFGTDWTFRQETVSTIGILLKRQQSSEAIDLAALALDCIGQWNSSREEFRERFLLAVLSSQLYWSIKNILPALDADIRSNWKYQQREHGISFKEAIEAENFSLSPRFVDFYRDGATYCSMATHVPPRKIDVDMEVYAAKWCEDKTLWVVFGGWAAIYLDARLWSFTPDRRCFSSVECTSQPMENLPEWLRGQGLQRKQRN